MLAPEFSLVLVSMLVQLTTIRAEKTQGAEQRMWRSMRRRLMRLSLATLGCDILSIHSSLMVRSYCLGNYLSLLFGMAMASAHAAAQVNACDEYAVVVLGHARVNIDSFIIRKVAMGIDFHTAATGTKTKPIHPPKCTISTTYFTLVKSET